MGIVAAIQVGHQYIIDPWPVLSVQPNVSQRSGAAGAWLAVFPETFIPGNPLCRQFFVLLNPERAVAITWSAASSGKQSPSPHLLTKVRGGTGARISHDGGHRRH